MVLDTIRKRSKGQLKVLFLESICNDANLIDDNVHLKLQGPDYKKMDPDLALKDFYGRLRNYEKAYQTISKEEEMTREFQYIQMIDVGRKMITCNIKGFLASQIIYYFLNFNLSDRLIFISRHGESTDNVAGRIGGDAPLTSRGRKFAKALAKFMEYKKNDFRIKQLKKFEEKLTMKHFENRDKTPPDEPSFSVFTSMLQRSVQSSEYFHENIFDVKQMRMLDELGSGKFDSMTYEEIQEQNPDEFYARIKNKMSYRYPGVGGESYLDVINRLKPIISELERTENHLLIITHRVVARILIAYFLNLKRDAIGELDVPLHTVYMFEPNPFGVEWKLYEFDEKKDWFNEIDPEQLENSKKVKQVGVTFRERKYSVVPTAPKRHSSTSHGATYSQQIRSQLLATIDSPASSGSNSPVIGASTGSSGSTLTGGSFLGQQHNSRYINARTAHYRGGKRGIPGKSRVHHHSANSDTMLTPLLRNNVNLSHPNSTRAEEDVELSQLLDEKLASLETDTDNSSSV
ncbi:unnamed protein product [Ambrosiozyma monospora]|uniref:Unnamed protein product n=1 Tax=Ambrosiozyma monospora TaxID=43982 RepID=A0ACB5TDV8_AMBMO|nr:unnamed protein product [Ambrosiozyma monospora]